MDAKYELADLDKIVREIEHLSGMEKPALLKLLKKYSSLFDGSLGLWQGTEYNIELQSGVKPYHACAYPITRIHKDALRLEVDRLVKEGVL